MAILQSKVAPDYQGRVFTLIGSLVWLTTPIGLGIAGPVADKFGILIWFALAGFLCLLSSLAIFFLPLLKNIEDNNQSASN